MTEPVAPRRVSYSQNGEDVVLFRALGDVREGFYVDVGAAWPVQDSVTKAFYDRGWSGINVDANPEFIQQLEAERPRDVNLGMAIVAEAGSADYFVVRDTGLSTLDAELAAHHRDRGLDVELVRVETATLQQVLERFRPEGDIHFLKVDVEGAETEVLASNDWQRFRPWVVVAEIVTASVRAATSTPPFEEALVAAGYRRGLDDGVNRFYVAEEHLDLLPAVSIAANVLDGFVTDRVVRLESELGEMKTRLAHAEWELETERASLADVRARLERAQLELDVERRVSRIELADARAELAQTSSERDAWAGEAGRLSQHLHVALSSRSWRVTRPLRLALSVRESPGDAARVLLRRVSGGRRDDVEVLASDGEAAEPLAPGAARYAALIEASASEGER